MTLFFIVFAVVELILLIDSERRYVKQKRLMDSDIHDCRVRLEAVEVLSESVRKLNGVVKDLEQKQPKVEPKNRMNTRAFIAGWDADEPEDNELLEKERVAKALNEIASQVLNYYAQEEVNKAHTKLCQQTLLYNNYPTLLGQGQQCIYPWQQTPSGAMLPLWYINRRLEDME